MSTREIKVQPAAAAAQPGKRRLIPIIDARFQWKYTSIVTALGVGTGAVMGGLLYNAHSANTRLLQLGGDPELLARVERGDQVFLLYLVLCLVGLAAGLGLWGMIVTHRIAGPMYLAARYLEQMRQGVYPEIRPLRKHDELVHVFDTLSAVSQRLRDRDAAVHKVLDDALAHVAMAMENPAQAGAELQHVAMLLKTERSQYEAAKPLG